MIVDENNNQCSEHSRDKNCYCTTCNTIDTPICLDCFIINQGPSHNICIIASQSNAKNSNEVLTNTNQKIYRLLNMMKDYMKLKKLKLQMKCLKL